MTAANYVSPYQQLELTAEQKSELYDTANHLVDEMQAQFEDHIKVYPSKLDRARWDLLRETEGFRVYHDRRPGAGTSSKNLHLLLTIGSVAGTLSDAMYGELNHTTDAMRLKTAYVKDTLADGAVLATILEPTEEKPFESLTVRWAVKSVPAVMRTLTKHRDSVYVEATGMRRLTNGEDVGFHLMHSITSPKTPALSSYDRPNLSICSMWRQLNAQRVHVYRTAYVEIVDSSILLPMVLRSVADGLISAQRVLDCALHKKLTHLVVTKSSPPPARDVLAIMGEACFVCGAQTRSTRHGVESACSICDRTTCKQCRVKRGLFVIGPDRNLYERKMRFCVPCLLSTTQLDPATIAREELQRAARQTRYSNWLVERACDLSMSSTSSISKSSDMESPRPM